ncbi:hypothetical protein [Nocardia bovistercoris]|uniref:Uncharacterized protein n=1 Tax=Nocardia bovistercoris TaxID=2785916 RepID=A0A931I4G0_9NOCA|nr:hypothetical protein [Nocardia bovistercoris]MBH0774689.1 hypothetical protein [Nocardia bovistercoris]
MILTWLAQAPTPAETAVETSWAWKDLGPYAVAIGTLCAAIIAGLFLRQNLWKTPYERLELLTKARADWPDSDPDGLASVERSIAFALEQIRRKEGGKAHPAPPPLVREAEQQVARASRRTFVEVIGSFGAVTAIVGFMSWIDPEGFGVGGALYVFVVVLGAPMLYYFVEGVRSWGLQYLRRGNPIDPDRR